MATPQPQQPQATPQAQGVGKPQAQGTTPQAQGMGKPQQGPSGDIAMYAAMLADRSRRLPGISGMVQRMPIAGREFPPPVMSPALPPGFAQPAPTSPLFQDPLRR